MSGKRRKRVENKEGAELISKLPADIYLHRRKRVKNTNNNGAGLISKLPTDIFFGILSRLSLENLSKCRLVCKYWFQTIQNPSFAATYDINNKDNKLYVISWAPKTTILVDYEFNTSGIIYTPKLPPLGFVRGTYSCNGLLLVIWFKKDLRYFVCNPITGDRIRVPRSPLHGHYCIDKSHTVFGYDPVRKVSKIINILNLPCGTTNVEIWNLVTRKWRVLIQEDQLLVKSLYSISNDPGSVSSVGSFNHNLQNSIHDSLPALLHGALHWVGYWKGLPYRHRCSRGVIICFKLETDGFYQLPLPPGYIYNRKTRGTGLYLLVVRECLSLVHSYGSQNAEIWVMKDYVRESSWEKTYIIRNIRVGNYCLIEGSYHPIKFMPNGEILLFTLGCDRLYYYDPVTKATRLFGQIDPSYIISLFLHFGSLVSPRSIDK